MKRKILNLRTSMAVILAGTILFTNIKSGLSEINVNAATEKQTEYKVSSPRVEKTPGKQKVTYDIIEFGSYPQSEVTGEALTGEITGAEYDEYGDCVVGENKYRRVEIKENEGENDTEENAEYRYFKYEPLEWRVLKVSEGYAYMLSDRVIDAQWYDASHSSWNTSLIRYWLNGYKDMGLEIYNYPKSMLGTAFNENEKKAMELKDGEYIDIVNNNSQNKETNYKFCDDRLFLLEIYELKNEDYGFLNYDTIGDNARKMETTDYAKENNVFFVGEDEKYYAQYWTNDIGKPEVICVSVVRWWGAVNKEGTCAYNTSGQKNWKRPGVCPAINLNLDSECYKVIGTRTIETEYEEPLETTAPPTTAPPTTSTPIETTAPPKTIPPVNTTNPPIPENEAGDIDGNGKVDLSDAKQGLEIALGIRNITNDKIKFGDMDSDGKITLKDAVLILKKALGIQDN